ncbi:MAG: 4'-phosphopantetheinyl transferase superfamily protein [Marinoscillum sp.]
MNTLQPSTPSVESELATINILCSKNPYQIGDQRFYKLLNELPEEIRSKIEHTKSIEKAQASLISKLLLREGFDKYYQPDHLSLDHVTFTRYDRPVYDDRTVDFNISHSYDLVACAISPGFQIGLDLEKIRPVNVGHFLKEFSGQELVNIHNAEDQCSAFFSYWTKKEAILKAEGLGLNQSLSEISFNQAGNEAEIFSHHWYLYPIPIHKGYCCWLASSEPIDMDAVVIDYQNIE